MILCDFSVLQMDNNIGIFPSTFLRLVLTRQVEISYRYQRNSGSAQQFGLFLRKTINKTFFSERIVGPLKLVCHKKTTFPPTPENMEEHTFETWGLLKYPKSAPSEG